VKFDFEFDDKRQVTFTKYISKIKELFSKLPTTGARYYFLIDEIDPRIGSQLFNLDLVLIRDLIVAVKNLNALFAQETRGFIFIAAVRTEVLHSVSTLGKEIHKSLEQFGIPMNWGEVSASVQHPLIQMLTKKVLFSERRAKICHNDASDQEAYVWSRYFRKSKDIPLDVKEFFDMTWMRPRDIVRLLKLCQRESPKLCYFSDSTLTKTRKHYSQQSLAEIEAQLAAFFDPFEVSAVNRILTGFKRDFSIAEFRQRLNEQRDLFKEVEYICKNQKEAEILSVLYRNGVIGNAKGQGYRFMHRGDQDVQLDLPFRVHKALWSRFSMLGHSGPRRSDQKPLSPVKRRRRSG
jgi:hypothetical protein